MAFSPGGVGMALPLVLGNTYMNNFFIWTTLTSAFTETSGLKVSLDLLVLIWLVSRIGPLEDLLEPVRLAALTIIAAVGSALCTSVLVFMFYVVTRWETLFFTQIYGYGPILMAYFILTAQKVPTEAFLSPPNFCRGVFPSFCMQQLPFTFFCVSALLRALLPIRFAVAGSMTMDFPLLACSFAVSWLYLRFFQHNSDGSVGDTSEDFQLVNLFPSCSTSAMVSWLSVDNAKSERETPENLSKTDSVTERRKIKALQALETRLHSIAAKEKEVSKLNVASRTVDEAAQTTADV
ncbi:hypothetical protein NSK_001110 [Nannochloropsis salina CCMP1776]|uniref:Uncharacterized protein n=1 Tax=Nannochloropsis salina CCMP1776 TaxID=1027361 RepID=A0A4D9D8K9_9STRA|nr:hypothetical protein NSK_001110 [Nannochloropsis salina CCMP1776]|eukprot:TFJ87760.1 hypothetical protein NSK_001110 [Nannochloropsis salina CCMP1776]